MSSERLISKPMRDPASLTAPTFSMPKDACDAHCHAFGPATQYRSVTEPHYTLPDGDERQLAAMADRLGIARMIIVQPSYYGTDSRCTVAALATLGERARGVAMVADDVSDTELEHLNAAGVRALRLDLFLRAQWPTAEIIEYIERTRARIARFGWHLQFYSPGRVVRDLLPFLREFDADFVIDHMGYMLEKDGLTGGDFDRLLDVIGQGRGWLKLSAPYRLTTDPTYAAVAPTARAIVAAAPQRCIWGSDWPHIPEGGRDTGALLNALAVWAPDEAVRNQILVDNPARLFGFGR